MHWHERVLSTVARQRNTDVYTHVRARKREREGGREREREGEREGGRERGGRDDILKITCQAIPSQGALTLGVIWLLPQPSFFLAAPQSCATLD